MGLLDRMKQRQQELDTVPHPLREQPEELRTLYAKCQVLMPLATALPVEKVMEIGRLRQLCLSLGLPAGEFPAMVTSVAALAEDAQLAAMSELAGKLDTPEKALLFVCDMAQVRNGDFDEEFRQCWEYAASELRLTKDMRNRAWTFCQKVCSKENGMVEGIPDTISKYYLSEIPFTPGAAREMAGSGEAVAGEAKAPEDAPLEFTLPDNVPLELRPIPAGTFLMGSPEGEKHRSSDEKQHKVTISRPFWLGTYPVTQEQYQALSGSNPSLFWENSRPVESVSWHDAMAFCERLNKRLARQLPAGYCFSLPTEAQWEYACRAGTTTPFSFGGVLDGTQANCDGNQPYGTMCKGPYREKTSPVGSYAPNAWGLYDMHGNVWEWCRDWYGEYPGGAATDSMGPESGSRRVYRGGCWSSSPRSCRSAYRYNGSPSDNGSSLGFRLALVPVQ